MDQGFTATHFVKSRSLDIPADGKHISGS